MQYETKLESEAPQEGFKLWLIKNITGSIGFPKWATKTFTQLFMSKQIQSQNLSRSKN